MNTQSQKNSTTTALTSTLTGVFGLSEIGQARLMALVFASAMLFTVGFAHSSTVHNAAHDTRHVQVFPCH